MTGPEVLDIARQGIWTLILISAPPMVIGLQIGRAHV